MTISYKKNQIILDYCCDRDGLLYHRSMLNIILITKVEYGSKSLILHLFLGLN